MAELTRRYVVMSMVAAVPFDLTDHDAPFVLKPWKDPAALRALMAYRDHCYPELRRDLDDWIRAITAGPVVRGDVGRRNDPYAQADASGSPAAGDRRPRAAVRRRAVRERRAPRPARTRRAKARSAKAKKRRR